MDSPLSSTLRRISGISRTSKYYWGRKHYLIYSQTISVRQFLLGYSILVALDTLLRTHKPHAIPHNNSSGVEVRQVIFLSPMTLKNLLNKKGIFEKTHFHIQKTREGCGCPKFLAGKVFRQISTLLENSSPIFWQHEMLCLPRFGHFPARKMAAGKSAPPSGTLLDFLL